MLSLLINGWKAIRKSQNKPNTNTGFGPKRGLLKSRIPNLGIKISNEAEQIGFEKNVEG